MVSGESVGRRSAYVRSSRMYQSMPNNVKITLRKSYVVSSTEHHHQQMIPVQSTAARHFLLPVIMALERQLLERDPNNRYSVYV